jgi:hypothetical protein
MVSVHLISWSVHTVIESLKGRRIAAEENGTGKGLI